MSHTVTRKASIRSVPALNAALAAAGQAPAVVTGDTATFSVNVAYPYASRYAQRTGGEVQKFPTPVSVNLKTGEVSHDADFAADINAFLAAVIAQTHTMAARKEGYTVSRKEVEVKGRRVLRLTIEG